MTTPILLAVDINDLASSDHLAQAAIALARAQGAKIHVLNVIPGSGMAMVGAYLGADQEKRIRAEARAKLADWAERVLPEDVFAGLHVTQGTIYHEIIGAANRLSASAIVVGAHRPALKDYLVGPNAARVVRHASQTVLVVR
ncbi:universal stress protein UspA [Salipiger aestuarii]|uniref:Nucleotide-binding universal stress UspA family protein n=1 Tax=Salipiger aestuarii TaxID=568098 RepID=A0A327XSH1_9RHOB|nr:universal stress protein [Salipiger aestuarii]EIE51066.1 UspA domain protein [Citreicella sp. 357]KAA8605867.1 universal stress protein UspA [Salipiger aestuarii]KAA8608628.1 universal stress protein UspA [Salipiger aestuarii]KAB2540648.1 universal stress protein UspA [Salipiger aestuarii]RAK11654.1 nucleotide-binding universal stress UspA family protein [Salipiger aestuarii]